MNKYTMDSTLAELMKAGGARSSPPKQRLLIEGIFHREFGIDGFVGPAGTAMQHSI